MSYTCGTGGWSGPLPGDPSTNSILTATPVFGGIDVTWTPAIVNPHAVAYTYLYRSTNPDFLTAVPIATVGGTHFYDKLENLLTYYYWIQILSINGTLGEVIGPASAIPRLSIDATIEALTGRIDNGVLAQSLKSEIDRISLIDGDLFQEIQDRIAANELLGAAIQAAQTDASQAVSMLNEEITQRITAYNVLLQTLNTMAGQVNDNKAAIETETTLRISNDEALAQQITNVQSAAEDNLAAVQTTLQTNINTVNGKVTDIGALYTAKVQVNGLIGGFGVYNDGTEVQAGFDVDTFWVGRTGPDKKKPFIIDSATGETYIDKAVIPTLTADMIDTRGLSIKDTNGNIILAAGTALDWSRIGGTGKPEDGATVGANSSNLRAGVGVNMVFNGDYTDGLAGTIIGWRSAGNQHVLGWNIASYFVQGEGTAFVYQPGNNGTAVFDTYICNGKEDQRFAVTPGQRYEFYAYLNAHRCIGYVILMFMDAAGNQLWAADGTSVSHQSGISSISDMRMSHVFAVAPANAVKALLIVRGAGINSNDPYVFFSRVYFGAAGTGQTEPSPWSPGRGISQITPSNVTTYIANAAIGNAQIGNAAITSAKIGTAQVLAANIANAQINTLHVGPDQITVPRYIESSAAVSTPTSGSWYEVLSFNSFPALGAPVLLFVTIDSSKRTRLLRNGVVLYDFEVPKDGNNFLILGQVSFMVYDSNPGDYPSYTVQIYRSSIHWNSSTYDRPRKLAVFAMKR